LAVVGFPGVCCSSPVRMDMSGTEDLSNDATGDVKMSFVMPTKYTKETLPKPDDPDVQIVEVPGHLAAALTFRGHIRCGLLCGNTACTRCTSMCDIKHC